MAALVSSGTLPLQVGLAHLYYNVFGVLVFYPIPITRRIPMDAARALGRMTRISRGFIFLYIFVAFFAIPMLLLGVSYMFESDSKAIKLLASVLVIVGGLGAGWFFYWFQFRDGKEKIKNYYAAREQKKIVYENLPQDVAELKENFSIFLNGKEEKVTKKKQDEEEGLAEA
jgi:solute carrier family 34 (sodium-dependent phosphate cotransporter)